NIRLVRISSVYETEPVDFTEQEWFLNIVVAVATELPPLALLDRLQEIEAKLGRVRLQGKGPRTIDLDLLLYDDAIIQDERLTVPHPRMFERKFVLEPLAELSRHLRPPGHEKTVAELLELVKDPAEVKKAGQLFSKD